MNRRTLFLPMPLVLVHYRSLFCLCHTEISVLSSKVGLRYEYGVMVGSVGVVEM